MKISYEKLFYFMFKNNITKTELAKKAKTSRKTIIKMESNEPVSLSVLCSICDAYDLEFDEVVTITKA